MSDERDPEVAEALKLCQQDAQLAAWFENHRAVQSALRARFRALPVPEGLREQILSEYKPRLTTSWWRRPAVLATAAIVVLVVSLGSIWYSLPRPARQEINFSAYRNRMVRTVVAAYRMDLETNDVARIRAYLAKKQAHGDYELPKKLAQTQTVGCGALTWQGKPVAMVCFRTGKPMAPGEKSDLFLFVIDRQDLSEPPPAAAPVFAKVSAMSTVTWTASNKVYLLAGFDAADLKQRL